MPEEIKELIRNKPEKISDGKDAELFHKVIGIMMSQPKIINFEQIGEMSEKVMNLVHNQPKILDFEQICPIPNNLSNKEYLQYTWSIGEQNAM